MCDVIWKGRPNSISLMHPIGVLTRLIPASIGITVVMWIVVSVLQMQSDHGSVESIIVDGLMCILLLPLFAPSVFIILEPLRRKLFWRMLNYEITGSSLRIVMRICNYRKVFEKPIDKIGVVSIRHFSGGYTIDFGELSRWYSFIGKNGGLCEDFEFSGLSKEDMRKVVEICLGRGVEIEAYKRMLGNPVRIAKISDFELYVKEAESKCK